MIEEKVCLFCVSGFCILEGFALYPIGGQEQVPELPCSIKAHFTRSCLLWEYIYLYIRVLVRNIIVPFYASSLTESKMSTHITDRIYQQMLRYEHHDLNLNMTVHSVLINIYMM